MDDLIKTLKDIAIEAAINTRKELKDEDYCRLIKCAEDKDQANEYRKLYWRSHDKK